MNFDILLTQVAAVTGNWTDASLRAQALVELQSVQTELEHAPHLPWFLWREQSVTITAGDPSTALPTGFIRFDAEYSYVRVVNADGETEFLEPLPLDKFQDYAVGLAADTLPKAFSLLSTEIWTAPDVIANATIYVHAAFADTAPADSATTNLWATHGADVLKYRTASRIAGTYLQDYELEGRLEQRAMASWDILKRFSQARMLEWIPQIKGED